METVTLSIDGRQITVEKGKTVLQAAIESGISVPYYCYHPGIGIEGSCRVCIVKIEKMPKLQTSCSTTCTDGMVVTTASEEVAAAMPLRCRPERHRSMAAPVRDQRGRWPASSIRRACRRGLRRDRFRDAGPLWVNRDPILASQYATPSVTP